MVQAIKQHLKDSIHYPPRIMDETNLARYIKILAIVIGVIATLAVPTGTYFVNNYKLNELHNEQDDLGDDFERHREKAENFMAVPRFTLIEYEQKEREKAAHLSDQFERLRNRIDSQDEFRLSMMKATTETAATVRSLDSNMSDLKKALETLTKTINEN